MARQWLSASKTVSCSDSIEALVFDVVCVIYGIRYKIIIACEDTIHRLEAPEVIVSIILALFSQSISRKIREGHFIFPPVVGF